MSVSIPLNYHTTISHYHDLPQALARSQLMQTRMVLSRACLYHRTAHFLLLPFYLIRFINISLIIQNKFLKAFERVFAILFFFGGGLFTLDLDLVYFFAISTALCLSCSSSSFSSSSSSSLLPVWYDSSLICYWVNSLASLYFCWYIAFLAFLIASACFCCNN